MRIIGSMIVPVALALGGCAGGAAPDATPPSAASATPAARTTQLDPSTGGSVTAKAMPARYDTGPAMPEERARKRAPGAGAGEVAVAVIGTPFFWVFKGTVCAASLVVAAPASALIAVTGDPYGEGLEILGDGVATNCGPPYVLTP